MVDRVDLTRVYGTERQRRWRQGSAQEWDASTVTFGRLADGRWFAERTGAQAPGDGDAFVFSADDQGRELALRLAYGWMRGGSYEPIPAAYGADGKPMDGLPWVRVGSGWQLSP